MQAGKQLVTIKSSWLAGGTLHCFFEGYFVLHHKTVASRQDLFGQLWKEYALSDSRYLTSDTLVLCAESITATVWGPLSYLTALCILRSSPFRYPLQSIVSLAHIYGDALYLSTTLVDMQTRGISYSRPEAYYFWFYLIILNSIWLLIPGSKFQWRSEWLCAYWGFAVLLYQSTNATAEAFAAWQEISRMYQSEGIDDVKKVDQRLKTTWMNHRL